MTVILIITCIITPLAIAFSYQEPTFIKNAVNAVIDVFFLMDIFLIFNTAIYDVEENLV